MPNIAPITPPQASAAPPASPSTNIGSDTSDTSFDTILNDTTASQQLRDKNTKKIDQTVSKKVDQEESRDIDPSDSSTLSATTTGNSASTIIRYSDLQKMLELQGFTRVLIDNNSATSTPKNNPEQINIPFGLLQNSAFANGKKGDQTLLTAELEQLITLHEKGVVTITKQDGTQVSLADLQNLKSASFDVNNSVQNGTAADAMIKNQVIPEQPLRQTTIEHQADVEKLVEDPAIKGGLTKVVVVEDERATAVRNTDNQSTHLRQDTKGQYLEAKIGANAKADSGSGNSSNQQTTQQDISGNAQAQGATQSTQLSAATETSPSYSQVSHGILDTPIDKTVSTTHPVAPFPGSTVSDESIVQQVAHKFNLQVRNQETQINIRLQPAELGELKIDLTYREGAIRANVFAQSQHVQEILEKNMPKLKELLQGQGIQVDDIQVAAKSDIAGDFDMLQEQLGKRDSYEQPQHGSRVEHASFFNALESAADINEQHDQSGVNVTV